MTADPHSNKTVHLKLFDKPFACTVCGSEHFRKRRLELKEPGTAFLKPKNYATCLICAKCGYVHWFIPEEGEYLVGPEPGPGSSAVQE